MTASRERGSDRLADLGDRLAGALTRRWLAVLALAATATQALSTVRVLARPGRPPLQDSIIMEYFGWYLTTGATMYVDAWDVKPPLSYEIPAVLALVAPGVGTYHLLNVLATGAAAVGACLLVGLLVHRFTDDPAAALAAGVVPLAVPAYHLRAAVGFKPKYFVVLAGLGAVYLVFADRPAPAGAAAAASAGLWQLAVAFPAVAVALAVRRFDRTGLARFLAGGGAATALVLAPVVLDGAAVAMVVETVLVPLAVSATSEGGTLLGRLERVGWAAGYATPVLALGVAGLVRAHTPGRRWALALGAWFVGVVLLVDFDAPPDLFPSVALAGLGLGFLLADRSEPARRGVGALLAVTVVTSALFLGGVGLLSDPHAVPEAKPVADPATVDAPYDGAERRALYWHRLEPTTCHVFIGKKQAIWIERTGGSRTAPTCGDPPPWLADRFR